jgi:hypothetical protein
MDGEDVGIGGGRRLFLDLNVPSEDAIQKC